MIDFVGIEGENPIVGGGRGGEVFLARIASPGFFDDSGAEAGGDFAGSVCGTAVDYEDFIGTAKAFDGARDVAFFVEGDDGGA